MNTSLLLLIVILVWAISWPNWATTLVVVPPNEMTSGRVTYEKRALWSQESTNVAENYACAPILDQTANLINVLVRNSPTG